MDFLFRTLRALFSSKHRDRGEGRYGGRASILQDGALRFGGQTISGLIEDVGLRGVRFSGLWLPQVGERGVLLGPDGREIAVRVVWRSNAGVAGAGLAFDS